MTEQARFFGTFELRPTQRALLENGREIRLGSRALEILIVLTERPSQLIPKEELIARVWPNVFVEEASLRVHIAALRKILGDGGSGSRFIANVPGRGYCFVGSVRHATPSEPSGENEASQLPLSLTRTIGRRDVISALTAKLAQHRFVTIVGHGGVGKTTTALAVAGGLARTYPDGVVFVDLAAVANPDLVASAIASALGLPVRGDGLAAAIPALLQNKRLLIILDSCERVIDAAAALAETIVADTTESVHLLATSREPLRVAGEWVQRLAPLDVPPAAALSVTDALSFPAVQMFVEHASAASDTFALTEANVDVVSSICRRLDGIPLALELVAARVNSIGVPGLSALLDDPHRLLTSVGRRTARVRHQTLRSALDWSYELLPEDERMLLRCLGVFAGAITLESAAAAAAEQGIGASTCHELIAGLVTKSLVVADISGPTMRYRLLDTTRFYAIEKLIACGELEAVSRRHAIFYRDMFERAAREAETQNAAQWLGVYRIHLDNVRAALDWAHSERGDPAIGIELTISAVPLWTWMQLVVECQGCIERALGAPPAYLSPRQAMKLHGALGGVTSTADIADPRMETAHTRALELSETLGDVDQQLRALWGLWVHALDQGRYHAALELAHRFGAAANKSSSANDQLVGERLIGYARHFLGDQSGARWHLERVLQLYDETESMKGALRFQYDQRITARMTLAMVLWLQGFPDQAMQCVETNTAHALAIGHPFLLGNMMSKSGCPIALCTGNIDVAERYVRHLLTGTEANGPLMWPPMSRAYDALVKIRRGHVEEGLRLLRTALGQLPKSRFALPRIWILGELALAEARSGEAGQALRTIEAAIAEADRSDERWCFAELLRVKGEIHLAGSLTARTGEAEALFLEAIDWARRQEVLSWELRATTSLARLWHANGSTHEAFDALEAVYTRFTEGFGTADLQAARALLDEMRQPSQRTPPRQKAPMPIA